jgi:hypothetical protein
LLYSGVPAISVPFSSVTVIVTVIMEASYVQPVGTGAGIFSLIVKTYSPALSNSRIPKLIAPVPSAAETVIGRAVVQPPPGLLVISSVKVNWSSSISAVPLCPVTVLLPVIGADAAGSGV